MIKEHKLVGILALTLLALCIAGIANAQRATNCDPATHNNAVCVEAIAPTAHVDGTPIVLAITYRVDKKSGAGDWTAAASSLTSPRAYIKNLAPGTYLFRMVAIVQAKESVPSNEAGRTVEQPNPSPPTELRVVQVIIGVDVAPVFTVLESGKMSTTWAGYARVGTACSGDLASTYLGYQWRNPELWMRRKGVSAAARVAAPCA